MLPIVVVAVPDVLQKPKKILRNAIGNRKRTKHIELLVWISCIICAYTFCSIYHTMNHSFQFQIEVYLIYSFILMEHDIKMN